jgi:hypothetical protein
MAEDWENLTYTRNWMKQDRKTPPWVSFGLKKNEQNHPNKMFEIALQPPVCYAKGNSANRIPLALDHKKYVTELNQTWLTYCDLGYKLDEEIKKNGLNFDIELKCRRDLCKVVPINQNEIQTRIKDLSDSWHR